MQEDSFDNQPFSMTTLEAGYRVTDSVSDYDETSPVGKRGLLQITSAAGTAKTFFVVKFAASEEEVKNLSCLPSEKHLTEHRLVVDIVDSCITYCLGSSILHGHYEASRNVRISNNFQEKLNEIQIAEGKPAVHSVSVTSSACIAYDGTTTIEALKRTASLARECTDDISKRTVLDLYREGKIRPYAAVERWYEIVEALRKSAAWKNICKEEQTFLKSYPQLFRHYETNQHHKEARKVLAGRWQHELESPRKGSETYHSYLRRLLEGHLE